MQSRKLLLVDTALKALLIALLLLAVLKPDLPQFEGKAFASRAVAYPLAVMLIPAGWWLFARRRPFPWAADILLTLPFLIDTLGNTFDLYDSIDWWDDANHFVNWAILASAFVAIARPLRLPWWNLAALGTGFGAFTAIGWELLEYIAFIRDSPELATAYTDTLGDLALGTLGASLASIAGSRFAVGGGHAGLGAES